MRKPPARRNRSANFNQRLRFEELEDRRMLSLTGDAPNPPYPLAQHSASPSSQFGPSQTVDDGVTIDAILVGEVNASAAVDLQGNVAGRVDAWIDFNRDGSFTGPGEQIANNVLLSSPASHLLEFDVPSWAQPGSTWARFRVSTSGNVGVGGSVVNGEVEDYQVTILPTPLATSNFLSQSVIEDATGASVADLPIFAADFDNDGDIDVVSATSNVTTNNVQWHRNNGDGTFTRFTIGSADDPRSIFAADVDGDGDTDILATSLNNDAVYWYSNPGGLATGSWTRSTISSTADGARQVFAADVDRDGDMDAVSASFFSDKIVWYDNNGNQTFTERVVNAPDPDSDPLNATNGDVNGPVALFVADIDRDGQLDIVTSSSVDGKIVWYQNDGTPATGVWTQVVVKSAGSITVDPQEMSAFVADFDGDGDMDVVTANSLEDRIAWYENDGTPAIGTWTRHDISTTADGAYTVFAADLDGDQDMDALSASVFDDEIAWYTNNGAGAFTPHTITSSGNADGATNVFAADLNGDGVLDVLSGSRIDNKAAWYPTPGFRITKSNDPLQVGENGSTDTFTVVLTAQPSSNVVLDIISNDTTESTASPTSRTFTTANWNIPQTVMVTGVNDAIVDGTQISTITVRVNDASSDNNFDPLTDQIVSVSTTDNDTAGFTVTQSGGTTQVSENGTTDTFTVVLTAQPSSNVVFDILSGDTTEATASPTPITFTPANWSIAQTVTVTGIDDAIVDGTQTSTITVRVNDAASDFIFSLLADKTVSVSTTDNDTAGFAVTQSGGTTQVSESGTTDTFTVVLTIQPTSNVVFDIFSSDGTEATISPDSLTFTTANWNIAQTVTVAGINDSIVDGTQNSTVTVRVNDFFSDNSFDPLADQTVSVSTTDNDTADFTATQSGGTTQVSESGTTDTFTVVLNIQPNSNVVFDILSGDTTEATASPTSLTFTTANWNVAQTVTVTGVNDAIIDGSQSSTITVRVNDAASDNNFDPLLDQTVSVTTTDNDTSPQGDYDHNGQVNAADYTVFRNTFGSTTNLAADGNASSQIDTGDYVIWRKKFGATGIFAAGAGAGTFASAPNVAAAMNAVHDLKIAELPPTNSSVSQNWSTDMAFAVATALNASEHQAGPRSSWANAKVAQRHLTISSVTSASNDLLLTLSAGHQDIPIAAFDTAFANDKHSFDKSERHAFEPLQSTLKSLLNNQLR